MLIKNTVIASFLLHCLLAFSLKEVSSKCYYETKVEGLEKCILSYLCG